MKILRKILAVAIVVIMVVGAVPMAASAAPAAPKFTLNVISETDSSVTLRFSLVSGSFNAFDIKFTASGSLGACQSIQSTDEFNALKLRYMNEEHAVSSALNINTGMFSVATTKAIDGQISICDVAFAKKSSTSVKTSDFDVTFSSCVVFSGNQNLDLTSSVSVTKATAGYIIFDTESVSGNYKDTKKIGYKSSYLAQQIKWESSNTKVATVDDSGNVKLTGKGTATIRATSTDGSASAECKVTVGYSFLQWIIIIVLFGWIWYI